MLRRFAAPCLTCWSLLGLLILAGCDSGTPAKDKDKDKGTKPTSATDKGPDKSMADKKMTDVAAKGSAGKRIIILINGNSEYWVACRAGMEVANKELGATAVMDLNDGRPEGQLDKLKQYNTQSDIGAVAISLTDGNNAAIIDEMLNLKRRGIHVVTIDSDVDRKMRGAREARYAFIGTDNLVGGHELGVCLKNILPDGGEYVTFVGRPDAQNALERVQGIVEGAGDKFKSLDNMEDRNDDTRSRQNVRNAITNHPEIKALVGIWSYNAPAIVDVVVEKKVRDKYKVVTFDAEPLAIKAMAEGNIDATVVQNPYEMGYQGVRLMKALIEDDKKTKDEMFPNYGKTDGDIYDTGLKVVVPSEGSPLKAEMFRKNTEFLKLNEFQAWLKKYNLTGS